LKPVTVLLSEMLKVSVWRVVFKLLYWA